VLQHGYGSQGDEVKICHDSEGIEKDAADEQKIRGGPQQRQASPYHHVKGAVLFLGRLGGSVVQHQVVHAQDGGQVAGGQVEHSQAGELGRPADITAKQVHLFNMADDVAGDGKPGEPGPYQVEAGQDNAGGLDASVEQGEVIEKD
jgi:hypothetical protein